jgi:hypothetical protein
LKRRVAVVGVSSRLPTGAENGCGYGVEVEEESCEALAANMEGRVLAVLRAVAVFRSLSIKREESQNDDP